MTEGGGPNGFSLKQSLATASYWSAGRRLRSMGSSGVGLVWARRDNSGCSSYMAATAAMPPKNRRRVTDLVFIIGFGVKITLCLQESTIERRRRKSEIRGPK